MPAEFRIDQVTPGAGVPGRTRHDLVPNEVITLVATSPTGPGVTYTWEILDKVGSTAVLSSTTGPSVTIGPAPSIVRPCSFRIKLTVNDNGTITSTVRRASVRTLVTGIFVPLFPESALSSGTLSSNSPDSSEDNAVYNNRAGLGIADQNWRGWAEWAYEITLAVESGGGAGGPPTGPAGGDLGDTYPNPSVRKLWGRAIENVAPNNNDYLRWDSGTVSWRPTAFPSGLPPTGAAGGDLAGNYPNPTVAQVQGFPVQSGTPAVNDIWRFDGVTWLQHYQGAIPDGIETTPALRFDSDPDTGIYHDAGDTIGFSSGGSHVAKFKRPLVAAAGTQISFRLISDVGGISGTAGFDAMLMDVQGAPTGSGVQRLLHFTRDGGERLQIMETGQILALDGTVGAPVYSFISDTDTGLRNTGVNKMAFVAGGVDRLNLDTTQASFSVNVYAPVGSAALPSYSFNGDGNTGFYEIAADSIGVSTGGVLRLAISTSGIDATLPFRGVDGSAANPGYEFVSDQTTGMFLIAAGVLGFSVSGTERARLTATGGLLAGNWLPSVDLTYNLGDPSFRWNNLWAGSASFTSGLFADGTVGAPSISFTADTNTGFYRVGSGSIGVSGDGLQVVRFQAPTGVNPQALFAAGSATAPVISTNGDENTGIFHPVGNAVAISSDGGEIVRFTRQTSATDTPQILVATGVAPATSPHYSFISNTDTGMSFNDGGLAFYADGQRPLLLTGIAGIPRAIIQPGTAGNPSLAFEGDQTTGVFRAGAGIFGIATSGVERVRFVLGQSVLSTDWYPDATNTRDMGSGVTRWRSIYAATQVDVSGGLVRADRIHVQTDGTAAAPAIVWGVYGDNGFFGGGADRLSVSVDGLEVMRWRNVTSTNPKSLITDGSTTHPGLGFISDEDTGFYRPGAGIIGLVGDGLEVVRFQAPTGANPQAIFAVGAAGVPSIAFSGRTNQGFFSTAATSIKIGIDQTTSQLSLTRVTGHTYSLDAEGASSTGIGLRATNTNAKVFVQGRISSGTAPSFDISQLSAQAFTGGLGVQQIGTRATYVVAQTSTALFDALRVDLTNTTLGSGDQNIVHLTVGGGSIFKIKNSTTSGLSGLVEANVGALTNATYSFISSPNSGLYMPSTGVVSATSNGTEVFRWQAPGGAAPQILAQGGTLANPPYSFVGGTSTGMLFLSPELAFSVGGTEVARMQAPAAVPQLLIQAGTAAAPSLAFRLNTDTGFIDTTGLGVSGIGFIADGSLAGAAVNNAGNVQLLAMAGTAAAPGLVVDQFGSGFYSPGGGAITAVSGGTEIFRWDSTPALYLVPNGTAALPILTFDADPDTGIYRDAANALAITTGGVRMARFEQAPTLAAGTGTGLDLIVAIGGITGTAGYDAVHIDVTGVAAGSGDKNLLKITEGGVDRLHVQQNGRLRAVDGAAATPTYSFLSDTNTGFYWVGADQIGAATGGTLRFDISTTAVTSTLPYLAPDGTAGAPSYRFSAQSDLGMYRPTGDTIGFTTSGSLKVSIDKTSVTSVLPFWAPNGTAGAPAYSFSGDTDNGLYYVTTNQVAMATGGVQAMRWETTVTVSAYPIEFTGAAMGTPTASTNRVGTPDTAGRPPFLALADSYFGTQFLATAFHDRQKFFLLPSGATTMVNAGFQFGTSGTVAYVTPTGTSFMTACQKNSFVTGAVSGNTADIHATTPIVAQGSSTTLLGFLFHARFAVGSDYTSNTRLFVGLINSAVTLTGTTNPGSLNANRLVGVGLNSGSTTLNVYTNDAGGAPQTTSTGLTVAANDAFDVWIWMPPNSTTRHVYVNRINGAAGTYSGSSFSFPPGANQWLYPHSWIATAEAAAKTLYVMRWAIEAGQ